MKKLATWLTAVAVTMSWLTGCAAPVLLGSLGPRLGIERLPQNLAEPNGSDWTAQRITGTALTRAPIRR